MKNTSEILKESLYFVRNNIFGICSVLLPIILPMEILYSIIERVASEPDAHRTLSWGRMFIDSLLYPIYGGGLILYLSSVLAGKDWGPVQCYKVALRYWPNLFVLYVVASVLTLIGLAMFIIPGIVVVCRLGFAEFICVLENKKVTDAFSMSWKSTKRYQWILFKGILILFAVIHAPALVAGEFLSDLEMDNLLVDVAGGCLYTILLSVITVYLFRVYSLHTEDSKTNSK